MANLVQAATLAQGQARQAWQRGLPQGLWATARLALVYAVIPLGGWYQLAGPRLAALAAALAVLGQAGRCLVGG
jgi:hypothetical protein